MVKKIRLNIFWISLIGFCLNANAQATFKRSGNYYALQIDSQVVTPYKFTEVSQFCEGIAWVNEGNLYGFIDTTGTKVTDYLYADVDKFQYGFAAVSRDTQDGLYGFINSKGKEICNLRYNRVKFFDKDYASVQRDSNWTLLDTSGVEVMPAQFEFPPIVVSDQFIIVCQATKWGVIDILGRIQYPFKYDLITSDGVAYEGNEKVCLGLL